MDTFFSSIYKFALISSIAFLASCGGSGGGSDSTSSTISSFNISDAKALIISDGSGAAARSSEARGPGDNRLFKIIDGGFLVEVSVTDEKGNTSTLIENPVYVEKVTDDFIIIGFGLDLINPFEAYVVNINSGEAYLLPDSVLPVTTGGDFKNQQPFQVDANDNIYYIAYDIGDGFAGLGWDLVKLSVGSGGNLVAAKISPSNESISRFSVDKDGNVAYLAKLKGDPSGGGGTGGSGPNIIRILMTTGGLFNLPSSIFWVAANGHLYVTGTDGRLNEVTISNGTVSLQDYAALTGCCGNRPDNYIFHLNNRTIITLSQRTGLGANVTEVFNLSNTIRHIDIDMLTIDSAAASSLFYYVNGNDLNNLSTIKKVDATSDIPIDLLPLGIYDVYSFSVTSSDLVTFSALRLSDGKQVVGEIDSNGVITILDESIRITAITIAPL